MATLANRAASQYLATCWIDLKLELVVVKTVWKNERGFNQPESHDWTEPGRFVV